MPLIAMGDVILRNPYTCGDSSCIFLDFGVPQRRGIQGGCKCLSIQGDGENRDRVREGFRWLSARLTHVGSLSDYDRKRVILGEDSM
jgi:hypothetical protein